MTAFLQSLVSCPWSQKMPGTHSPVDTRSPPAATIVWTCELNSSRPLNVCRIAMTPIRRPYLREATCEVAVFVCNAYGAPHSCCDLNAVDPALTPVLALAANHSRWRFGEDWFSKTSVRRWSFPQATTKHSYPKFRVSHSLPRFAANPASPSLATLSTGRRFECGEKLLQCF